MPLTYYSRSASKEFWAEHWSGQSLDALVRTAETSPLTDLILSALPPRGAHVLEAGCGLGQYVVLLRRQGYRAVGADWSLDALSDCRVVVPGTPLSVMDLRQLGFRSGAFGAYLSLGVVEHDPDGPDRILQEARRVLEPGGVLVLSVPYLNVARRLGAPWIRRRNRRLAGSGGEFYQFVFSGGEARKFIKRNGFRVIGATPYDPARLPRKVWRQAFRGVRRASNGSGPEQSHPSMSARAGLSRWVRRLLYTRGGLHAFGHMILLTAAKR